MDVEVIIPWAGRCPDRSAALEWVTARYDLPYRVVESARGPWCKAIPAMAGAHSSAADIVVIADADAWCEGLTEAVSQVAGGAAWAIPHRDVHRLTGDSTAQLLAGAAWESLALEEPAYPGVEGGGFVVAHRDLLLTVPLDSRFAGWGQEDESWAAALWCLLGAPWRGTAPLVHLWHPPQPRISRRRGSPEGWALRLQYMRARHDPAAMRLLLQEAVDALHAAEPPLHDLVPGVVRSP